MRLGEFIVQNHDAIVAEWVSFASTLHPWADGRTTESLRDHAEELLKAVVIDMQSPQTDAEQEDKSHGEGPWGTLARVGQKHAAQRLQTGFDLQQLVSEFRALRASVVRLWSAHQDPDDDLTRFHESIDEGLTASAVRYSEMLEHTREQFVGVLGHDLRNPLSSIVMGAQLLTQNEKLDDTSARIATRILNTANRMARMVGDLLDLTSSRLGTGIAVSPRPMDLAVLCDQVISELEIVHPKAEIRFAPHGALRGEWDPDRLYQAISNLVANALQHGAENGKVTVVADQRPEEVRLLVHNEGPPIPERALEKIFDPMVREPARDHRDRHAGGRGLGLFIARAVAAAHGGALTVTSTEKDGTTFTLRLPVRPMPVPELAPAP